MTTNIIDPDVENDQADGITISWDCLDVQTN